MKENSKKIDKRGELWGISFVSKQKSELLTELTDQVNRGDAPKTVVTPNPEQIVQSLRDSKLKSILSTADWALPDGMGTVWASRLLHHRTGAPLIPRRIAGVDVVADLLVLAQQHGWRVLLLGGRFYGGAQLPERMVTLTVQDTPVQWFPGYADIAHPSSTEEQDVEKAIEDYMPDIVFVAFGAPWQEYWIADHQQLLSSAHVKVVMAVGGSFDYLLDLVSRAPVWLQRAGGEWLYRLTQQPWRWRRQLRLLSFVLMILRTWINPRQ